MLSPTLPQTIGLQVALIAGGLVLAGRARALPLGVTAATVVAYLTVPLFIAVIGIESAVYASDFLLPIILFVLVRASAVDQSDLNGPTRALGMLLLVVPAATGIIALTLHGVSGDLRQRELQETALWFYRNASYLAIFVFATRQRLDAQQFSEFLRLNFALSVALAAAGALSYFGPVNLATYEQLATMTSPEFRESLDETRIGSGFLGLFRGAVGQWYCTIVLLAVGTISSLTGRARILAAAAVIFGVGVILLSFSRAGMVGLAAGLSAIGLLSRGTGQKVAVLLCIVVAAGWMVKQSDAVGARVTSIAETTDDSSQGRLRAWSQSAALFLEDPQVLAIGVGPASRERVFQRIGGFGAHNEYVDVVYRMGIIGLVALLAALVVLAKHFRWGRRNADTRVSAYATVTLSVLLANCVMGLTQEHLLRNYSGYTTGLFLFLLYGAALGLQSRPLQATRDYEQLPHPAHPNLMR